MQSAATSHWSARGGQPQPLEALNHPDALLKVQTVTAATGLSTSTIYRGVAEGTFPKPLKRGTRCTRWRAGDVTAWLRSVATVDA